MLSMLLLLAAPQSAIPLMPPAPPAPQASMRVLGQPGPGCASLAMPVNRPVPPSNGLLWHEGQEPVGHYLLLERRVNGCSAPVVVNYRVPGSNAIGREAVAPGRGDRLPAN